MKRSIKWNINDLSIVRPADLRFAFNMIKLQADAAIDALVRLHEKQTGISIDEDTANVAVIELKDNGFIFTIRDEETDDKNKMPYQTRIIFPGMGAYDLPERINNENN